MLKIRNVKTINDQPSESYTLEQLEEMLVDEKSILDILSTAYDELALEIQNHVDNADDLVAFIEELKQ